MDAGMCHLRLKAHEGTSELSVTCELNGNSLFIHPDGFGRNEEGAAPIGLQWRNGRLCLVVWSDIFRDAPTHVIDLDGAKVSRRNPVVFDLVKRLRTETLDPAAEGELIHQLTQQADPSTGKRMNLRQITGLIGRSYSHVRNRWSLVMPHRTTAIGGAKGKTT